MSEKLEAEVERLREARTQRPAASRTSTSRAWIAPRCSPGYARAAELVFLCAECGSMLGGAVAVARRDGLTAALATEVPDGRAN